ncbi:MAG: sigma-70 family RNA polymerase sigma factor [Planctomycetes bacterium]|nr:sigma-70 family RNA polymerase sigma factor [Planctomycetota bacterium]MCL4730023.1 sigma-70 family RNA polymerase sigma factor [Planctomycetota bacterium]
MAQDARAELTRLAVLHHGPLLGYCRRRLGSESLAEDALQEVFLRAHKYFSTYDPARDARKWLFGIAHNVCVEVARSHGRLHVADELPEPADNATAVALERLAREESLEHVRRELERLPDRTRRILELRFFGQMTSAEIAKLEGMNETAVRVALHRALEGLRSRLNRAGDAAP